MSSRKQISNTFTVTTMDDPVSVQAQYSPDMNIVHSTWQDGDLYMRTRESDEATWSEWHLIVGENGGETDYSFYISAYPSSTNAQTAPADIQSSNWQDTPMQVTDARPYLWMRIQKKAWNSATQSYDITSTSYVRINGESILAGDLSQEWYSVSMTNLGETSADITFETTIHVYYGSTLQTLSGQPTVGTLPTGVTVQSRTTGGKVTFKIAANTSFTNDRVSIPITATCAKGSVTKNLLITGIRGGAVYQLVPSASEVVKRQNGTFTPSANLTCSVSKITNGITSTPLTSEYTLKMKVNGGSEQDYAALAPATVTSSIVYVLYVGGVVVDRESVPLVTDGINGTNGQSVFFVDLSNETENIACNNSGNTIAVTDLFSEIFAFYGLTSVVSDCKIKYTNKPTNANAYIQASGSGTSDSTQITTSYQTIGTKKYIRLRFNSGVSVGQHETLDLSIQHATYGTMALTMTIIGIKGGATYQLVTSTNTISKGKNGTYSPSTVTCSSRKIDAMTGGAQNNPSEATLKYTVDGASTVYDYSSALTAGTSFNKSVRFLLYVDSKIVDTETIGIVEDGTDGTNGTSPYLADLNNEMDAIQCDHDGNVVANQQVQTTISMWHGSSVEPFVIDNIYRNGTQMTWDGNNNHVYPRHSGSVVTLEYDSGASIADIDDIKITLHSYYDSSITQELHFTINGVRANAIYRLVPSCSSVVKKKNGTYNPNGNVTCDVEKIENGAPSTPSSSEYTLEKSVNGGSYGTYSATAASSITSDLKFRLKVGGVIVDLETIPLVSDGDKGNTGDSAPSALATPDKITIPCYSNGNVKASSTTSVTFSLKVGTNSATVSSISCGTRPTGVTVTGVASNAVTITVGTSATASGLSAGVTFTVTGTYGGKTYSATVTVALIGSTQGDPGSPGGTGPRGKIGRFFYYAGEFDASNTTQTFVVNDAQAPYFSHGVNPATGLMNCHVYNPEDNGTFTMAQMWANSNQSWNTSPPWEVMNNEFRYLITQAIFGQYAHLGSFIVNGDWLISQYGTINGSSSTFYTRFYPEFIHGCSLCKSFDVAVDYVIAGSAYFIGGKTYYIKVSGSSFSSGSQLNVRMYNGSSNVGTTLNLTSSLSSGTITFVPSTSGTYYLRANMNSDGQTAKLTAYVDCFVPNYAVDGSSGDSYQMRVYASGGIRSPFTYIDNRANYNIFNATINDNVALYTTYAQWDSGTHYVLPWDASQSGRKVCITNYKWNGSEQPTEGYAVIDSESGKYFYEDGIKKTALTLSREGVELLGFGTPDEFYGWIVIKRFDLVTKAKYGRGLKALAIGRYTHSSNTFSYKTFDGSQLTFSKVSTGIYRIYYDKNKNWFDGADDLTAMITPLGSPLFIYLKNVQNAPTTGNPYFEINSQTTGINSGNITYSPADGSFDVIIVNSNDWVNTQYEIL